MGHRFLLLMESFNVWALIAFCAYTADGGRGGYPCIMHDLIPKNRRLSHPFTAGMRRVGCSPTRETLRETVGGGGHGEMREAGGVLGPCIEQGTRINSSSRTARCALPGPSLPPVLPRFLTALRLVHQLCTCSATCSPRRYVVDLYDST